MRQLPEKRPIFGWNIVPKNLVVERDEINLDTPLF
jgi:hypothetical protein